jgi:hypothetical protein
MAAAQSLTQSLLESVVGREAAETADVRLDIHDTSRLEWAVSVALPERGQRRYAIELDLEVPAHVLAAHSPWDHLQELARLDGPDVSTPTIASIDDVRRFAVAVAGRLGRSHEGFARHARIVLSPFGNDPLAEHVAALESWIGVAVRTLDEARRRLDGATGGRDVARETSLADEYLSTRFLELLAGMERTLATVYEGVEHASPDEPCQKRLAGGVGLVDQVDEAIGEALADEIAHRRAAGYPEADADSPKGLERYLDRASQLKKHFQEVLFLEAEHFAVSERLYHIVAAGVALMASTWAFVWQLYLSRGQSLKAQLSSLVLICLVAGLVYAVKDRMKEVGRTWFARNVHRFYAQRVARYRTTHKTSPNRDVVVRARESFLRTKESRPDPLHPESGATLPVSTLRYRHQGTLEASKSLADAGISRVKHVFRYDLSPIFARLDDATKPVPVFDQAARRVRFAHAPRCYRVPVRLVVRVGDHVSEQRGSLVLHKRGLERIELE